MNTAIEPSFVLKLIPTVFGIKDKPFALFVTGFFDNVTDNTVGINFKTKDGSIAVFNRLLS
jgi:hypothetical protein